MPEELQPPFFLSPLELWGMFSDRVDADHAAYRAVTHTLVPQQTVRNLDRNQNKQSKRIGEDPE